MKTLKLWVLGICLAFSCGHLAGQSVFTTCPGVTVTATLSAGMSGQPDCAGINAVLLPGGWTGTSGTGFVRYNWSSAVSSTRIEFFSVNTNDYATISTNTGGILTITSFGGCAPVSGNVVGPYTGSTAFGTTAFNVSSTIPFTQLNFVNTGASSGWVADCPFNVILAVELDYFQAHYNAEESSVRLDWQTATESNSSHFIVERSPDGSNWEALGKVNAAGHSSQSLNYAFEDRLPLSGKSMYRLQQVDEDGSYRISAAETVFVDDYLKVYPTFADHIVHIAGLEDAASVQIFDKLGKEYSCPATTESNGFSFNTTQLESGFYILRIPVEGAVVSRKIWVRH